MQGKLGSSRPVFLVISSSHTLAVVNWALARHGETSRGAATAASSNCFSGSVGLKIIRISTVSAFDSVSMFNGRQIS